MPRSFGYFLVTGLGLAAVTGCSGSDAPAPPPQRSAVCEAPNYESDSPPITIDSVRAELVDSEGAAVPRVPVQVCGLNRCINDASRASGQVNVSPHTSLQLPAFKYGDGFDFAELAFLLGPEASQDLGQLLALPLPPLAEGSAFPHAGTVTQGEVSLMIDEGSTVAHDVVVYADSELRFRSVPIPAGERALDPQFEFELGYGLAPLGTTFCPPARFSVVNSAHWPSGTEVEVFVQGLDVTQKWAPYGSWVKVAEASVTADEQRIASTSGGITILSAIALRRK